MSPTTTTSKRPSFCDICWRSRDGHGMKLLRCRDCGVVVHDVCYGQDPTSVPPNSRNFQCLACAAVGTTVKVRQRDPKTGDRIQFTITERPTECCLCTVDHKQLHPHAMHPLYDNYGTAARQVVLPANKTKPARLAWVHSLCGFSVNVVTSGCVYACTRDGCYGAGSDDEESYMSMMDDSTNSDLVTNDDDDDDDGHADSNNNNESSIHHFGYVHPKPRDQDNMHLRSMKERQTDLKCIFCGQKDNFPGVYRLAVQCNANDSQEYEGFQGCHETLGNSTCLQAMHVGCAAWGPNDDGEPPNMRRAFYFPGTDEEGQYGETVVNLFCPIHAQDLIKHGKYNNRVYQYFPNGEVVARKVGLVVSGPEKRGSRVFESKSSPANQIGFIPPLASEVAAVKRGMKNKDLVLGEPKKKTQKRRSSITSLGSYTKEDNAGAKPGKILRRSSTDSADPARKNAATGSNVSVDVAETDVMRRGPTAAKAGRRDSVTGSERQKQKTGDSVGGVLASILQGKVSNLNKIEKGQVLRKSNQTKAAVERRRKVSHDQNAGRQTASQEQLPQGKREQTAMHQPPDKKTTRDKQIELPSQIIDVELLDDTLKGVAGEGRLLLTSPPRAIHNLKQEGQTAGAVVDETNKRSPLNRNQLETEANTPTENRRQRTQVQDVSIEARQNATNEHKNDTRNEISCGNKTTSLAKNTFSNESLATIRQNEGGSRPAKARAYKISEGKAKAIEAKRLETSFHDIVNDVYSLLDTSAALNIKDVLRLRKDHWQKELTAAGVQFSLVWDKVEKSIAKNGGMDKNGTGDSIPTANATSTFDDKAAKTSEHVSSSTAEQQDNISDEVAKVSDTPVSQELEDQTQDKEKNGSKDKKPRDWSFLFVGTNYNQTAISFTWDTIEEKSVE